MTTGTTTSLMNWLSLSAMHSLGWALVHFFWQGTALAALAAAAMALCRRASTRYIVGVAALGLMLLAPLATFVFYSQPNSGVADAAKLLPLAGPGSPIAWVGAAASSSARRSSISPSLDALPWLVEAWLLGVAFFSLRSAGGY